jgi:hypothetical protein
MHQPKTDTATFRVRLNGVPQFRRAGVLFTTENTPYDLAASDLSKDQKVELLNTHTLVVEELAAPAAPAPKAKEGGK